MNTLVPFLHLERYGRSILENCSFIVSSVLPDARLLGRAFQPRLSGVTCEFLDIRTNLAAGELPFLLAEEGALRLRLQPILPGWLFTTSKGSRRYRDAAGEPTEVHIPENAFAFKFIGRVRVVYHNPDRQPTYGENGGKAAAYGLTYLNGRRVSLEADSLVAVSSTDTRQGLVRQIDVSLSSDPDLGKD